MLFCLGAISNETSLFTYDTADLLNTYFYAEKHDPAFVPVYSVIENPDDPLYGEMSKLCGQDPFCKFDTMTTKNLAMGNATKISFQSHMSLVKDLEPGE